MATLILFLTAVLGVLFSCEATFICTSIRFGSAKSVGCFAAVRPSTVIKQIDKCLTTHKIEIMVLIFAEWSSIIIIERCLEMAEPKH